MKDILQKYDISVSSEQYEKLSQFVEIFRAKNSHINLSAIRDEADIWEKHIADSLIARKYFDFCGKTLDVGSGGWFPGIPLKIVSDTTSEFVLLDSVGKKSKATNDFIETLWLENITALTARSEELGHNPQHREQYDYVVSRATAYLPTLLEYCLPFLQFGGIFIAYKLDNDEEITESSKALEILGGEILEKKEYSLAGQNRILLIIQKVDTTPKKYPRDVGVPLKTPL